MIRLGWAPGAARGWEGPVVVSVTDFAVFRGRDMPRVWLTGMKLRRAWPAMQGAVGLWLWALPLQRRSGSVSVWRSEADLLEFVRWPVHVEVMRRNRASGALASTLWESKRFDPADGWRQANTWIRGIKG